MSIPSQSFEQYTIAFYNVENLFDVINDPSIMDQEFTEFGRKQWTESRYQKKLVRISDAISRIGYEQTGKLPAIVGLAEVENKKVLNDLVSQPKLANHNYDYIHYNSPDERGIDVALLYDTTVFKPTHSEPVNIHLEDEQGVIDTTRDILYIEGVLAGTPVRIYVNHWPSRRDGAETTDHKRVEVAKQLMHHITTKDVESKRLKSDLKIEASHHVIIMGDFNDDPENNSIREGILPNGFDNVTAPLKKFHRGSLNHQFKWNLFDQIMVSDSLHNDVPDSLYFYKADIFDDIMLRQWKGKYRGQPARTFVGRNYKGGYSDHFPVFAIFRRN
ncbi:Endonuclease/Exonuclease/phosphatase family protein [Nonlabens xylanidelens]|uniref:Endonuclease/Exonuclease/phosphatase family protein n=1 Tax=Nonlabens xylanidelens TaxID=191564 RepID=A0A2S6IQQ5_9FLAO|nr:endonuclease/exonuclease/phosphatase [Nonlabens xylanidelens]PPK96579.1 Endonuclease/Exonuclease/phosphatase family protein [Nonlabens xylanidelens]PQJ13300.1 endonuclease/exonuclease/phosphatase [Nonlabens xylanidelens]